MTINKKIKFTVAIILLGLVIGGSVYMGWRLREKFSKPKVEVKVVESIKLVEYDDPEVFNSAVKEVSEKYGIKPEVFYAIKNCEGGYLWAWSKTSDGGYFQINIKTAKEYGAKDLEDLINPYKSAELAAKIIQKEGIEPWMMEKCIIEKLIKAEKK